MAGVKLNVSSLDVLLRRFVNQELTGGDLAEIRSTVCEKTQESLGNEWGFCRNTISRMECAQSVGKRERALYLGLMFETLCEQASAHDLLLSMRKARKLETSNS